MDSLALAKGHHHASGRSGDQHVFSPDQLKLTHAIHLLLTDVPRYSSIDIDLCALAASKSTKFYTVYNKVVIWKKIQITYLSSFQ